MRLVKAFCTEWRWLYFVCGLALGWAGALLAAGTKAFFRVVG